MRLIDADALLQELPVHPSGDLSTLVEEIVMHRVRRIIEDAPTVCEWVSIKDGKMPEEDQLYVVHQIKGEITHWFNIPKPPEEEQDG